MYEHTLKVQVNLSPHGTGERETQGKVLENTKLVPTSQSSALFIVHCGFGTLREILRLFDLSYNNNK